MKKIVHLMGFKPFNCCAFGLFRDYKAKIRNKTAFSLVEMLMALLVASLLMAALAPVMTRKLNDSMKISVEGEIPGLRDKRHIINYNDDNCPGQAGKDFCKGTFTVPSGFNGNMDITLTGAGGGGGASMTTGSVEYKSAGIYQFKVPEGVNEIEITLVEGGAGGAGGWIDDTIKGYAWTFSGTLDRKYVPETMVSENVKNVKVSGNSTAVNNTSYSHGTAALSKDDTKYIAGGKVFVTMAGGGGGGGRGYAGTGGGGSAARKKEEIVVTNGTAYNIKVGTGGKGHACSGYAGCGGAASSFGGLILAGGGGGGVWGFNKQGGTSGTDGENGGSKGISLSGVNCASLENEPLLEASTGGYGASPGGLNGGDRICDSNVSYRVQKGSNGGNSVFGTGGVYSYISLDTRHGQGYGGGGCGSGTDGENPNYPLANAGADYTGDGAPGFVAAEWHDAAQGGAGGGGGSMAVKQRIKVFPGETLAITVGAGGKGGKAGKINGIGNITYPTGGEHGYQSTLKRGNNVLLATSVNHNSPNGCGWGACGGDSAGKCPGVACSSGWVYGGWINDYSAYDGNGAANYSDSKKISYNPKYPGYTITGGGSAGNHSYSLAYTGVLNASDTGGNGGQTMIDNVKTCTYGAGSTVMGQKGANATGYGGCGGGGGYGLADGGDGAPGYAKIIWNPDKKGTGGGGASGGTIVKKNIAVKSGAVIGYQIGKGGDGGSISGDNTVDTNLAHTAFKDGQKGGDTIFGINSLQASNNYKITAGGGNGGLSPIVTGNSGDVSSIVLTNGTGGTRLASNACKIDATLLICQGIFAGGNGDDSKGGDGANSDSKYGGAGGKGTSTSKGRNTDAIGAGGGGSGVTEANSPSLNENEGGRGGNGQIIIEWRE